MEPKTRDFIISTIAQDHKKLDKLFNRYKISREKNARESLESFIKFKEKLQEHLKREEDLLLPLLKGTEKKNFIHVLREDHEVMKKMILEIDGKSMKKEDREAIEKAFIEKFEAHEKLEYDIFNV